MIEKGQIYVAADPRDEGRRIVVLAARGVFAATVSVATITPDGREVRPRSIQASQFHESAITIEGKPRKTGYILERNWSAQ